MIVAFYARHLPHWQPADADFLVTWRLHGTLPGSAWRKGDHMSAGSAFVAVDRELDAASDGPLWLKDPELAGVSRVLLAGISQLSLYELLAWVVMANHVHVLVRPCVPLHKALMNVKSASSRAANAVLGRTGQRFWQDESYDHWARNDRERNAIVRYIEFNPVRAGLVTTPEEWPWSSAGWPRMAPPHTDPP